MYFRVFDRTFCRALPGALFYSHFIERTNSMDTKVALIGIVVKNRDSVTALNDILHKNAQYVIGRMGLPYEKRGVSIRSEERRVG